MHRTLSDIDLGNPSLEDRTITLSCSHTFTVDTLDGHCGLGELYDLDTEGQPIRPALLTSDYSRIPDCPTCRAVNTSPRYSRGLKRAQLDVTEKNETASAAAEYTSIQRRIVDMNQIASGRQLREDMASLQKKGDLSQQKVQQVLASRYRILSAHRHRSIAAVEIFLSSFDKAPPKSRHLFTPEVGKLWQQSIREIDQLYRQLERVTNRRSSQISAFDAAFQFTFDAEQGRLAQPGVTTEDTQRRAHQLARLQCGVPPSAQDQIGIEAILLSINLRYKVLELLDITIAGLKEFPAMMLCARGTQHHILISIEQDAKMAARLAEESINFRQLLGAEQQLFRIRFEHLKIACQVELKSPISDQRRGERATELDQQVEEIIDQSGTRSDLSEAPWFSEVYQQPCIKLVEEIKQFALHVRGAAVYQHVSAAEKESIVKAFGFSHSGHWYRCSNGRTCFTISNSCIALSYCRSFRHHGVWRCYGGLKLSRMRRIDRRPRSHPRH